MGLCTVPNLFLLDWLTQFYFHFQQPSFFLLSSFWSGLVRPPWSLGCSPASSFKVVEVLLPSFLCLVHVLAARLEISLFAALSLELKFYCLDPFFIFVFFLSWLVRAIVDAKKFKRVVSLSFSFFGRDRMKGEGKGLWSMLCQTRISASKNSFERPMRTTGRKRVFWEGLLCFLIGLPSLKRNLSILRGRGQFISVMLAHFEEAFHPPGVWFSGLLWCWLTFQSWLTHSSKLMQTF